MFEILLVLFEYILWEVLEFGWVVVVVCIFWLEKKGNMISKFNFIVMLMVGFWGNRYLEFLDVRMLGFWVIILFLGFKFVCVLDFVVGWWSLGIFF